MERTVPSPAWASNVYFNSCWTNLFVSLSLRCLKDLQKKKLWILCVDTTILFFNTWSENLGNTFEKTRFSSEHGVHMWRSWQLQPSVNTLSLLFLWYSPCLSVWPSPCLLSIKTALFLIWLKNSTHSSADEWRWNNNSPDSDVVEDLGDKWMAKGVDTITNHTLTKKKGNLN